MHSDPLRKKLSGARKVFFIVISVSALWHAAEKVLRGLEGTQAAFPQGTQDTSGPGGHPSSRPRRAPRQLAAGHPRNKRPRRAPKEQRGTAAPTVPKDSVCRRHSRNKWWWEQAASRPRKLSGLEKAPIQKKNFPTPEKFFFGSVLANLLL